MRCHVLDVFHEAKIEIVLPEITSQRSLPSERAILPKKIQLKTKEIEELKSQHKEADEVTQATIEKEIARKQRRAGAIERVLEAAADKEE